MPGRRTRKPPFNPWATGRLNQGAGARHEAYIRHTCMLEKLLCRQSYLAAKRTADKVILQKQSDVDFHIYGDASLGEILACEAKSFEGPRFGRSALVQHQMATLQAYADYGLYAGYVVLLRSEDAVFFFPITTIVAGGARAGFGAQDGLLLGSRAKFSLRRIFEAGRSEA